MMRLVKKQHWLRLWLIPACTLIPVVVVAKTSLEARYPYDPACQWGRLSNGKGMLHRCLSEKEASDFAATQPLRTTGVAPKPKAEPDAKDTDAKEPAESPNLPQSLEVSVGPIEAADGEITLGRLGLPVDRYKSCILDNGGLKNQTASLVVKFLVRAEEERAEGAGVESFQGLSEKAARCVAEVVDRRKVGSPSAAMTGARLHFKFSR